MKSESLEIFNDDTKRADSIIVYYFLQFSVSVTDQSLRKEVLMSLRNAIQSIENMNEPTNEAKSVVFIILADLGKL